MNFHSEVSCVSSTWRDGNEKEVWGSLGELCTWWDSIEMRYVGSMLRKYSTKIQPILFMNTNQLNHNLNQLWSAVCKYNFTFLRHDRILLYGLYAHDRDKPFQVTMFVIFWCFCFIQELSIDIADIFVENLFISHSNKGWKIGTSHRWRNHQQ